MNDVRYSDFEEALLRADALSLDGFRQMALGAHERISGGYTVEMYEENMYGLIKEIIEKTEKNL